MTKTMLYFSILSQLTCTIEGIDLVCLLIVVSEWFISRNNITTLKRASVNMFFSNSFSSFITTVLYVPFEEIFGIHCILFSIFISKDILPAPNIDCTIANFEAIQLYA